MKDRPAEETFERNIDMSLWKQLWRFTRPYRKTVAGMALFAVATAFIDTATPLLTRKVIDTVANKGLDARLAPWAAVYLLLAVGLATCIIGFIYLTGKVRTYVAHDIRRAAFANLQRLGFSFFDQRPVGWLMARMTSDCDRLSQILAWGVLDFLWGLTVMTAMATVMLVLDWRLALATFAVIPVLWWISTAFKKRILRWSRIVRRTNSRITASYNEGIMGARTTKSFVREPANLAEFSELTSQMHDASVRNALYTALYVPLVLTLGSVATGVALALGGFDVTMKRLSIGTLIAFLLYTRHFFEPVNQIAHWFAEMQMAQAAAERVIGIIETEPIIADSTRVQRALTRHHGGDPEGHALDGGRNDIEVIELRDVSFAYENGPPVLQELNLTVQRGQTIALVGSTGGGKSTIVNLICRFYEPTSGRILLDGVDYRDRSLAWLHSKLGIVLQTPHLFSGTISDNIRYGRREATPTEVEEASRLAGAHGFISRFSDGYETQVGEGGVLLSVGEKQLISFARAILARPDILVMDEATSSVDTETEKQIQRGMAKMLAGRTSFVIAHRLSTIRSADRILVIDRGKIVEQGTHGELLEAGGRYRELYTRQRIRDVVMGHSERA